MEKLCKLLTNYSRELQHWNTGKIKRLTSIIKQKSAELKLLQDRDRESEVVSQEIKYLQQELHTLMEQEDLSWKQRAKRNCFEMGIVTLNFLLMCFPKEKEELDL